MKSQESGERRESMMGGEERWRVKSLLCTYTLLESGERGVVMRFSSHIRSMTGLLFTCYLALIIKHSSPSFYSPFFSLQSKVATSIQLNITSMVAEWLNRQSLVPWGWGEAVRTHQCHNMSKRQNIPNQYQNNKPSVSVTAKFRIFAALHTSYGPYQQAFQHVS